MLIILIRLNWLNDYIETGLGADQIAEVLSDLGFPCEGIEPRFIGDDVVIDVEITSNRGDCLGYIGVARELAAATGKELKKPAVEMDELDSSQQKMLRKLLRETNQQDVKAKESKGGEK
jgi:phenylalanyl-tRNA synthetase beta chain